MLAIKPVFKDLSNPQLLAKCTHGKTQDVNESFNNLLWTRAPKNVFVRLTTLRLGVYDSVGVFNEGNIVKCKVLEKLGINVGLYTAQAMKALDVERIRTADKKISEFERQARKQKKY